MRRRYITDIDMIKLPGKIPNLSSIAEKIEYELDFDYNTSVTKLETFDDFLSEIIEPYKKGEKIFYRGEKVNKIDRTLIPTLFRQRHLLFNEDEIYINLDANGLLDFYNSVPEYLEVYKKIIGKVNMSEMYNFLSFSQHYFGISPLIDLTKSPFVALSFALKNRKEYDDDVLFYTVEIKNDADYTCDMKTADKWVSEYNVTVFNDNLMDFYEDFKFDFKQYKLFIEGLRSQGKNISNMSSPSAKLIDVPTNDLMRFQQGVFLLLNDFTLVGKGYLTKNVRDDFLVKKWLINKDICPILLNYQLKERPYYNYDTITDLSAVVANIRKSYTKGKENDSILS